MAAIRSDQDWVIRPVTEDAIKMWRERRDRARGVIRKSLELEVAELIICMLGLDHDEW
jgi:hypothetical protein